MHHSAPLGIGTIITSLTRHQQQPQTYTDLSSVTISSSNLDLLMIPVLGSLEGLVLADVSELETLMLRSAPKLPGLTLFEVPALKKIPIVGAPHLSNIELDFTYFTLDDGGNGNNSG